MSESSRDPVTEFAQFGEVRLPKDAEAPILGPSTRQALHSWLYELNNADDLAKVGVTPRRRALLQGPPGTGKTTLAWHIAARLGLILVVVETPSLLSAYISESGQRIGELFRRARNHAGTVALFFDEIDAVASKRTEHQGGASKEQNNIVIALLQMMDRHKGLMFAATNKPDSIDPAVWRRFQLQIEVGLPAAAERFAIVKRYMQPFDASDETIGMLANSLTGASPALIREVIESVKRDLILGPKLGHAMTAPAMFGRIIASIAPSSDMPCPPLWHEDTAMDTIETLATAPWPPRYLENH